MHNRELIERYVAGPSRLRASLAGLSESDLQYQYDPAKWSAKEIAIHVADMDLVASFRMKRILSEPDARYPGVDQDRWAAGLSYQGREVEPSLRMLEAVRAEMGPILAGLPAEAWSRSGIHEVAGEQTLQRVVEVYTGHLERHIGQIEGIRARLGK